MTIIPKNPVGLGDLILKWAKDPTQVPKTVLDLRKALDTLIDIPTTYPDDTPVQAVQSSSSVYVLKLPELAMAEAAVKEICDPAKANDPFPLPPYYFDKIECGPGGPTATNPKITNCDFLLARIADYTFSVCR